MKKQFRFSIIEMMVVIAIILILMSLVMPVLQIVKEKANRTKTLATAKSIGLIMVAYAEDDIRSFKMPYPISKKDPMLAWGAAKKCWSTSVVEMLFSQKYMRKGEESQLISAGATGTNYVSMNLNNDATPAADGNNKFWVKDTKLDFHLYCDFRLTSNVSGKLVLVSTYDNEELKDCQFEGGGWVVFYADKTTEFVKRANEKNYITLPTSLNTTDVADIKAMITKMSSTDKVRAEIPAATPTFGPGVFGLGGGSTELMGKRDTDPAYKALVR